MIKKGILLVILLLLFSGCSVFGSKAKITSAKYVERINAGGVAYSYEGKDIIQMTLDFTFDDSLASDLDQKSEDYRKELYAILAKGAHFYYDDNEVESTYGYWPEKAGSNNAKEMSLFYVVPSSAQNLRFVYDGNVLGEGAAGIDTTVKPDK